MPELLSIECHKCGSSLTAKLKPLARKSPCPKCGAAIDIPASDLDFVDPRVSKATPDEIIQAFDDRDLGAILITFNPDGIDDQSLLSKMQLSVSHTDNTDEEVIRAIVIRLAGVLLEEKKL